MQSFEVKNELGHNEISPNYGVIVIGAVRGLGKMIITNCVDLC